MADHDLSHSNSDEDPVFDLTADMLIHDFDDEQTLDEEEAMSNEDSIGNELDDLQKESEIPVEELLAMYGYSKETPSSSQKIIVIATSLANDHIDVQTTQTQPSSFLNVDSISSDQDKNCNITSNIVSGQKVDVIEAINTNLESYNIIDGPDKSNSVDLNNCSNTCGQMNTADLFSADLIDAGSDDDEDYDPEQDEEDWKKTVPVGLDHQAMVPDGFCLHEDYDSNLDYEDRMLWKPDLLDEIDVANYLMEIHKHNQIKAQGIQSIPVGSFIRDDEQALYLLLQCDNNYEEALRRHKLQAVPQTDPMSLWTEEECRNFEMGLRQYGKDFFLNQQKVKTRSVREIVQFYYLWKKTERHDAFAARTRLEKKKYTLHPGVTDYMDRFISEFENPLIDTTGITNNTSLLQNKNFNHLNNDYNRHQSHQTTCTTVSSSSIGYGIHNSDQCCDVSADYCAKSGATSCSFDGLSNNNLFVSTYPTSCNNNIMNNDVSSSNSCFTKSCYDFPTSSSNQLNNHHIMQCGEPVSSYSLLHPQHLTHQDIHRSACYVQHVESSFSPSHIFSPTICNSSSFPSAPGVNNFYPMVDSLTTEINYPCSAPKHQQNCVLGAADDDSFIVSTQMCNVPDPHELTISDINMLFDNVDKPSLCHIIGGTSEVINNGNSLTQNEMMGPGGDATNIIMSCLSASSSDTMTNTHLPPSMQKLCSDDGIEPTLDSISASIQDLVDPEGSMTPENILSVLEAGTCASNVNSSSDAISRINTCAINDRINAYNSKNIVNNECTNLNGIINSDNKSHQNEIENTNQDVTNDSLILLSSTMTKDNSNCSSPLLQNVHKCNSEQTISDKCTLLESNDNSDNNMCNRHIETNANITNTESSTATISHHTNLDTD